MRMLRTAASVAIVLALIAPALALSLEELTDNLDTKINTKVYVKEYWKKVRGTEVTWRGEVQNVTGGFRGRYKVYLRVDDPGTDYNVVLITEQKAAAGLKKGRPITFSGVLEGYDWATAGQVREFLRTDEWTRELTVVLKDGKIFL